MIQHVRHCRGRARSRDGGGLGGLCRFGWAGGTEGTDAFIPFDSILDSPDLPTDKTAPIAIDCRSGNMPAQAATELTAAGYTNMIDLEGGMNAWAAAGDALLDAPSVAGN